MRAEATDACVGDGGLHERGDAFAAVVARAVEEVLTDGMEAVAAPS